MPCVPAAGRCGARSSPSPSRPLSSCGGVRSARSPCARCVVGLVLAIAAAPPCSDPRRRLPAAPQLFAFRLLLVVVAAVGVPVLLLSEARPLDVERWRPALPLALWAAWLCVALLWAPDKTAGLTYLARPGDDARRRRRRRPSPASPGAAWWPSAITMIVAYAAIVGVTGSSATTGLRLPTSRLADGAGSQYFAVTSVFHNQNDLATYLAICWPFLLGAAFFTRRARWLVLAVLLAVPGALAFVRTGSRSSLLAAGVSTVVLLVVLVAARQLAAHAPGLDRRGGAGSRPPGRRRPTFSSTTRRDPMLRQFRLSALVEDITDGERLRAASAASSTERGLVIAGGSLLLGAGPGQAHGLLTGGHRGPRPRQPAQLVARDLRRGRPARAAPPPHLRTSGSCGACYGARAPPAIRWCATSRPAPSPPSPGSSSAPSGRAGR